MKRWVLKAGDPAAAARLSQKLHLSSVIARLLVNRGHTSETQATEFLCPDLSQLPSPYLFPDMEKAVTLVREAISHRQKILLVGDYDADGLTGTALLYRTLQEMGGQVFVHIPHRMNDGYGLKPEVVLEAASSGVGLLITIDCGTTAFEEMNLALAKKIRTLVVDHHDLDLRGRPAVDALLNPLEADCRYPSRDLASVGVAFTLVRALVPATATAPGTVFQHLDLVALGTIADFSPLVGENRILVKAGLHALAGSSKKGLQALMIQAKLEPGRMATEDVSFVLGPRINAAGRMGSAEVAFQLLVTEDVEEAKKLARKLDQENRTRGEEEREALKRALNKVTREVNFAKDRVIVLEDDRWHPGVMGIIANRLVNRFHRPTVIIAWEGSMGKGSARSIPAFHLVEALENAKSHLVAFGGHPAAAGLTIERSQVEFFRKSLNRFFEAQVDSHQLIPELELDMSLPLSDLTETLMRELELLAPFGSGNPHPVFSSGDVRFSEEGERPPFDPRGMRFVLKNAQGRSFEALRPRHETWEVRSVCRPNGRALQAAYSPLRRRHVEGYQIELKLHDLKPA